MAKVKIRAVVASEQENIPDTRGGKNDRVEYDVAVVGSVMDANCCAKALAEIYPRNTMLEILAKDDDGHMAIIKEYKGKKPASVGAVNADKQPDSKK